MSDDATYGSPVFDWSLLTVPTPLAMVRGQLGFSWLEVLGRLVTLDQDEFEWEPGPDALRVVRRGEERSPRTLGVGEWVMEWPEGSDSPQPRTIAWLVAHLTEAFFERWEWTFGDRIARRDTVAFSGEVDPAIEGLTRWVDLWRDGVDSLPDDEVFTVGLGQATEIDAQAPFGHLVLHMNRELIHHGAEIMVLQDLYRARHAD
ncbi:DinB family protein [Oerskovia turbata]|uniref:DinB family protein n=1 Tax=Oerskovia turbata TaxID=1713 RepID=A0A4Q1KTE8_9CELL|nr:DinB family protein [Oerskovia turbata]RXR25811.1 DinB family protein [Oerskovia turbata]RXR33377.1 DinB family protein [Oerskovia turbata]TGJ96167.1 DinB family protein [Actinotalea fermentans ATCC 43279 = JCM 9966 = DSM 3133]